MRLVAEARAIAHLHPDLAELAVGVAVGVGVLLVSLSQWGLTDTGVARGLAPGIPLAVATAWTYRRRRQREERRERGLMEQRVRLARELHDAVAGQVAVIGIQAAAARRVLATKPAEAALALERIEGASRAAVGDLRTMLIALRDGSDFPVASGSEAGLLQLDELAAEAMRGGLRVTTLVTGTRPADVPPAMDHAAYRIVQEALTNAMRHGAAPEAAVDVAYRADALELGVRNPLGDSGSGNEGQRSGMGLRGIRERAALFGGEVTAGPSGQGDWAVSVRLPWHGGHDV